MRQFLTPSTQRALRGIWYYFFLFRKPAIIGVMGILLAAGMSQGANFLLKYLIDALMMQDVTMAGKVLIFFCLAKVCEDVIWVNASAYYAKSAGWKAVYEMRGHFLAKIHSLDFAFHVDRSAGELLGKLDRGEAALGYCINDFIVFRLRTVFEILVACGLLFQISPFFSIVFFGGLVIYFMAIFASILYNFRFRKTFYRFFDRMRKVIIENVINFDTVKYFAREASEQASLRVALDQSIAENARFIKSFNPLFFSVTALMVAGYYFFFQQSILGIAAGTLSLGEVTVVIAFVSTILPKLSTFALDVRDFMKHFAALSDLFAIFDTPPSVLDAPRGEAVQKWNMLCVDSPLPITFDKVNFSYVPNVQTISDFSLHIAPGESVAFVGLSGAGKSTLIKLLLRFYDVDNGSIKVGGVDISHIAKSDLRSKLSVVPQETILFQNTLLYNITYGRDDISCDQVQKALRMAAIGEFVDALPEGLDTLVGERGIKLSGGQRQRIGIARVFLHNAPVLIFDEATSQLDSESELLIQKALWEMASTKTTIIIAHRLSTVMRASKIVIVDKGKIVDVGTHEQLKDKEGSLYQRLLTLQNLHCQEV